MPPDTLILRQPDDWHTHLRDGDMLRAVVGHSARQFARAIVMPNLRPPITTIATAQAYRQRIKAAAGDSAFTPLMTAYLTDDIAADEIARGFEQGVFTACKLYPANATTNSEHGVTAIAKIHRVLERMQTLGMPLLIHGEVTDADIDIFDREAVFIERVLSPLLSDFPALKVVLEHITTDDAVQFVSAAPATVAATITPHHLAVSRNALFAGGIRPHLYCLPVLKRERHRLSLRRAATSGNPKFFLGTDTAPHASDAKESACGCAGIFNAPMALESYATVFEQESALPKLEGFASEFGPRFYGLPLNTRKVRLLRTPQPVPDRIGELVPFHAGQTLDWQFDGVLDA
ncbi:MAG: dihydroorotase [Xanthomonadaceae bacterium]|nr:dihydroorotase [Xanthomonadaceae bacterium]MDP2184179.1 dihydroorotase [Xanthomonadales bacterium]MDZ4114725.1 dihydroorotase [Xanthomonadaceae bacterium]MDZ4377337.1 dihydroorotase [Xanthomonadaceae bacterium]